MFKNLFLARFRTQYHACKENSQDGLKGRNES